MSPQEVWDPGGSCIRAIASLRTQNKSTESHLLSFQQQSWIKKHHVSSLFMAFKMMVKSIFL